jgi:hypothetical protein
MTMRPSNFESRRVRRRPPARGVTMLELVTCLAISSMLVGGLASAIHLAVLSLDSPTGATATTLDTNAAIDQLNADVRVATAFTERTATAITCTVPDRTGDGLPETIRYAWAGAGSPLTRAVNGLPSPAASLLGNIQSFNLSFLTKTVQPQLVESAEQALCSYTAGSSASVSILKNSWVGEYFKPSLPANAILWRITRIRLKLKQGTASSKSGCVQVSYVDAAQKPVGPPLDTCPFVCSSLPSGSFGWIDFPFTKLTALNPAKGLSVQIESTENESVAVANIDTLILLPTGGMSYCKCTDGNGTVWTTPSWMTALEYQVYGTVTTNGPPQ